MPGENAKWTLQPWIQRGLKFFDTVDSIPDGYTLISSHHPPWREPLATWIRQGRPWIEIEYGYWGPDTPRRQTARVTYCGHHNLDMHAPPHSRAHLFDQPPQREWQNPGGTFVLAIQPVEVILQERTGENLQQFRHRITQAIGPYWPGEIRWRKKVGAKHNRFTSFVEQLAGAHAVVGERTMACTEACLLGIPGYTVDASMSSLLMGGIENLAQPARPDRSAWWEHICWSQFSRSEFTTSVPADLTELYQIKDQSWA